MWNVECVYVSRIKGRIVEVKCILCLVQCTASPEACVVPCFQSPSVNAHPGSQTTSAAMVTKPDIRSNSTSSVFQHISPGSSVTGPHRHSASQGRKPRSRPFSGRFQNDDRMMSSAGSGRDGRQAPTTPVR